MNVISASNAAYVNADKTAISLDVIFEELKDLGAIQFIAMSNDTEEHGRDIYAKAIAGDFGDIAAYVPPVINLTAKCNEYKKAIQNTLNAAAVRIGYLDINDACSYAGVVNDYQTEALTFFNWRLAVWDYVDEFLTAILAGSDSVPSIEEIIGALPPRDTSSDITKTAV